MTDAEIIEAIVENIRCAHANGYGDDIGQLTPRELVDEMHEQSACFPGDALERAVELAADLHEQEKAND